MPNHREVPRWRFGDVLTNDEPSSLRDHKMRAMFAAWEYTADYNPTESVCILIKLSDDYPLLPHTIRAYCGWWTDVEA